MLGPLRAYCLAYCMHLVVLSHTDMPCLVCLEPTVAYCMCLIVLLNEASDMIPVYPPPCVMLQLDLYLIWVIIYLVICLF